MSWSGNGARNCHRWIGCGKWRYRHTLASNYGYATIISGDAENYEINLSRKGAASSATVAEHEIRSTYLRRKFNEMMQPRFFFPPSAATVGPFPIIDTQCLGICPFFPVEVSHALLSIKRAKCGWDERAPFMPRIGGSPYYDIQKVRLHQLSTLFNLV
jgi:hypothetical protein